MIITHPTTPKTLLHYLVKPSWFSY